MICALCAGTEQFDIIWENEYAYLTFDNYGVHFGHLLLIPKCHVLNAAVVYSKIEETILAIMTLLKEYFNTEVCIYEHGNVTENLTTNISIDHAHVHFLPVSRGDYLINTFSEGKNIRLEKFSDFYSKIYSEPYHILSIDGTLAFYTYDTLPSQTFRKVYAQSEGVKEWDWKSAGHIIKSNNNLHQEERKHLKLFIKERMPND